MHTQPIGPVPPSGAQGDPAPGSGTPASITGGRAFDHDTNAARFECLAIFLGTLADRGYADCIINFIAVEWSMPLTQLERMRALAHRRPALPKLKPITARCIPLTAIGPRGYQHDGNGKLIDRTA